MGHLGDDLRRQSLDWCTTLKTKQNLNQQQHKPKQLYKKTTNTHKLTEMKPKPGRRAFYAIWPGNGLGLLLQLTGPARGPFWI